MLYLHRIGISERIDVNKTSALKDCDIFHYRYFLFLTEKGRLL